MMHCFYQKQSPVTRFEEDFENYDSKLAVIPMDNDIEMDAKGDKFKGLIDGTLK